MTAERTPSLVEALVRVLEKSMFGTAKGLLKRQCDELGFDFDGLTPDQARRLVERVEHKLTEVYGQGVAQRTGHEMRLVIGRYSRKGSAIDDQRDRESKQQYIWRPGQT